MEQGSKEAGEFLELKDHSIFNLTGILYSLTKPLAEAEISIFAISTFDTDYLMVKVSKLEIAIKVLEKTDFLITGS